MPPSTLPSLPTVFLFDVFGTVFDWRSTVVNHLNTLLTQKLQSLDAIGAHPSSNTGDSPDLSTPEAILNFSGVFAQEWRDSYKDFVLYLGSRKEAEKDGEEEEYIKIDTHHLHSLQKLLKKYNLTHLFTPLEIQELSRIWHKLRPWEDSKPGIDTLKQLGTVSTLSNGNINLLKDLSKNSGVNFDVLLSGEVWRSYKPDRKVYIGACEILGVGGKDAWREFLEVNSDKERVEEGKWREEERGRVAMVAAHIRDLRAAKDCGLTTIYVERPGEDDGGDSAGEKYLREGEGWIDMWVKHDEGGIEEVGRRLAKLRE